MSVQNRPDSRPHERKGRPPSTIRRRCQRFGSSAAMDSSKGCRSSGFLCMAVLLVIAWITVGVAIFTPEGLRWRRAEEAAAAGGPATEGMVAGDEICATREGHYEAETATTAATAAEGRDPWRQMKWMGQPARCPVRGHLIERLDPANNFRRGFALRFTDSVEDRAHILPWLLGARVDLNRRKRRVFLDLGSNTFASSIGWFLRMYPCDFTEIHAFEVDRTRLRIPKAFDEDKNVAPPNSASRRTRTRPGVPAWMLKRVRVYNKMVADADDAKAGKVNITRFIKDELRLSVGDAVVVKMDIEESEWPILTRWMDDADMAAIVDELFVEVHYRHASMYDHHWARFSRGRDEATRLLADLRWKGFYVHSWP